MNLPVDKDKRLWYRNHEKFKIERSKGVSIVEYDYKKLCGRITEVFGTQAKFAEAMGTSERTVSQKLNSKIDWKQGEIRKACSLLDISISDSPSYFFTLKVQN